MRLVDSGSLRSAQFETLPYCPHSIPQLDLKRKSMARSGSHAPEDSHFDSASEQAHRNSPNADCVGCDAKLPHVRPALGEPPRQMISFFEPLFQHRVIYCCGRNVIQAFSSRQEPPAKLRIFIPNLGTWRRTQIGTEAPIFFKNNPSKSHVRAERRLFKLSSVRTRSK